MTAGWDEFSGLWDTLHTRQGARLPHWTVPDATYSVVFRLGDSLPQTVLRQWNEERASIYKLFLSTEKVLNEQALHRLKVMIVRKIDQYLDNGYGACWLKENKAARIVADAFHFGHGNVYTLIAWSIMPNHVHVVFKPNDGHALPKILHSWKSFTGSEINKLLCRRGMLWQSESYDHIVRNDEELVHCILYAWQNPEKAGLQNWQWRWMSPEAKALLEAEGYVFA